MPAKPGRTSEYEYSVAVLRYLNGLPSGEASVTTLKKKMPSLIALTDGDKELSGSRPNELVYQQVVGNIVSHAAYSAENFLNRGLLAHKPRYLSITAAGRNFLKKLSN
jgi:hypothetical protein